MKSFSPMLIAALGAAIFEAAALPADAAAKADTSRSLMALPPKAADQKVRQDLLSVLQPAGKFVRGMHARVVMQTLRTRPYGTGLKGLCRMDELSLRYAPASEMGEPINDPLRPVGLEAKPLFHAAQGPILGYAEAGPNAGAGSGDCKKLQSDKAARWFSAANPMEAARGVNLLLAGMAAVRSGALKVKDCNIELKSETCEAKILQLGEVSKITAVDRDCPAGPGKECFSIRTDDFIYLMIIASFATDDSVEPDKVDAVSAGAFIVVT